MDRSNTRIAQDIEPYRSPDVPEIPDFPPRWDHLFRNDEKYVRALNAPPPTEKSLSPPLSAKEQQQVGDIVMHFQKLHDEVEAIAGGKRIPDSQTRLDFEQDMSCLSHDQLQRLLPSINKQIEPSGYRMVEMPEGREIAIGHLYPATAQYEPWGYVAVSLNCLS